MPIAWGASGLGPMEEAMLRLYPGTTAGTQGNVVETSTR